MKILLIHRANFDKRPPVISALFNLLSLGVEVTLCTTGITSNLREKIEQRGGRVILVDYLMHKTPLQLIIRTLKYRAQVKNVLGQFDKNDTVLWVEGNYTFTALIGILKGYALITQIQEMHKNKLEYFAIKRLLKNAKAVFIPEYNRAYIYKCEFNLKDLPYILPNKPDFIPTKSEFDTIQEKHSELLDKIKDKKVILYQGLLCDERDLTPFVRAANSLPDDYLLVLLGHDYGVVNKYLSICQKVFHIPYLSAPDYLLITSKAYIGIVTYAPNTLNTVYCAPNKIFEYAAFSIPIIANDIPGLRYPILEFKSGIIVDENNPETIVSAISKIEQNYEEYSSASLIFYNSVDNKNTIETALRKMCVI